MAWEEIEDGDVRIILYLGKGKMTKTTIHGGVQEVGLLADHADDGGQVGQPHVAQVGAVDADGAAGRVIQPGDQRAEGGLARSGLAGQGERGAGRDVQVDGGQGGAVGAGVGEAGILEPDVAADLGQVDAGRAGWLVDPGRQVEVFEDPREQGQRADHRDAGAEQPGDRPEQGVLQGGEGDQGTDADGPGGDRQAGREVDDRRDRGENDAEPGHPPAPQGRHRPRITRSVRQAAVIRFCASQYRSNNWAGIRSSPGRTVIT